jgi:hypothetical protein
LGPVFFFFAVMAGLVPAIYVFRLSKKGVDTRDKPGHDVDRAALDAFNITAVCPSHPD